MQSIPRCSFILTSRRLTAHHVRHIAAFGELLGDRQLMAAFIHFGSCRNPMCREANGKLQRWFQMNPEVPVTIIARMEWWRTKVEGWPTPPAKAKKNSS